MSVNRRWHSERGARRRARQFGVRHAKKQVEYSAESVVHEIIKSRPVDNPAEDAQLQYWHDARQPHPDREAWDRERREKEEKLTKYSSRWLLRPLLVGLLITECAGITQLLSHEGMANPERVIVAVAGSCILFYLTYKAAQEA